MKMPPSSGMLSIPIIALLVSLQFDFGHCFVHPTSVPVTVTFVHRVLPRRSRLSANIGGNEPPSRKDGNSNPLDDFLDPNKQESDNLKRARSFLSEGSLPITFSSTDTGDSSSKGPSNGSQLSFLGSNGKTITALQLKNNPYLEVVSKLSPSELIAKFTSTAHPRVQDAVRATILGLIGNLPKMAFETKTITTGERLAHLMFQLQMTGYLFKNADYRLSLSQSLNVNNNNYMLSSSDDEDDDEDESDNENIMNNSNSLSRGKVRGKIKITLPQASDSEDDSSTTNGDNGKRSTDNIFKAIEVDAAAYMSELRNEVETLRQELLQTRMAKEEAIRKDLLLYIRTLPKEQLKMLTATMSEDVLVAMKALVNVVMSGIGEGKIGPDTVTEQSGEAMAQLCMWQLVVGFNLRELEVREEMKASLAMASGGSLKSASSSESRSADDFEDTSSIDFNSGGFE
jgi:hypothetical protein